MDKHGTGALRSPIESRPIADVGMPACPVAAFSTNTSTNGYRQATLVADPMFMIYYATRNRAAVRTFTSIKDSLDE